MLTDVNNYYCHLLHEIQGNTLEVTSTVQKLEEKLKKCYGEKICIVSGNKRKGNILYGMAVHCHWRRLFRNLILKVMT